MSGSTRFEYENTVDGLCERVTSLLNDDESGFENTRYDKGMVRALVCDSFWLLASFNPGLFSEKREIPLTAGEACQNLPDGCSAVNTFIAIIDKTTGREVPIAEADYNGVVRAGYYPQCVPINRRRENDPGVLHAIPSFKVGRQRPDSPSFVITPVPPEGSDLCAVVQCNTVDEFSDPNSDNLELPGQIRSYFAPLMELVRYYLTSSDVNSPGSAAMAAQHLAAFAQLSRTTVRAVQRVVDTAR